MHLLQSPLTILLALSFSILAFAAEGSLNQRKICISKNDVCHLSGEPCCDGLKCALAHGGKAAVGYCTESGKLLQDYYQVQLP